MLHRRTFVAALCCAMASPPVLAEGTATTDISPDRLDRAKDIATDFLNQTKAPGLSVAYARNGAFDYIAAFGQAGPRGAPALDIHSRMRIASVSKPITATAILQLIDSGKIMLNQSVFGKGGILDSRFQLSGKAKHKDWLEQITVDHLLTHTAGGWSNESNDPMFSDPSLSQDQLIERTLRKLSLKHAPGQFYAYSNFGYCLLGRVVEETTGQSYEDYVTSAILRPAGAESMELGGSRLADRKPMETAYLGQDGEDPYGMNIERMDSHGGWIATAADLVRFGMTVDGYGSVLDVLSKASVLLSGTSTPAADYYARGWAVNPNHRNRWHTGSLPGTTSILVRVDGGECFAGIANSRQSGSSDTGAALDSAMWAIHDALFA